MKENSIKNERSSIEEDIKILEEMIENANIENMDMNDCFGGEHIDAIEHVLSDYKRVLEINKFLLKENEELKDKYATFVKMSSEVIANSIPVQKVKDKIEEIQKEYNKLDKQIDEYINDVNKDLAKYYENKEKISIMQTLSCSIDILQELLEGRK